MDKFTDEEVYALARRMGYSDVEIAAAKAEAAAGMLEAANAAANAETHATRPTHPSTIDKAAAAMVALRDMGRDVTGVEMKRITNEDKDAIRVVGAGDGPWPLLLTAFSETTDEFIAKLLRTVAKSQH